MFSEFFVRDLQITVTQFGLAIALQMIMWGATAPIFGALADKFGGNKVTILCFIFYAVGIFLLYSGPNTGIFFQINLGLLVGIGLGGTALSVQISVVGKHFSNEYRGMAVGIVTAMASIGFFFRTNVYKICFRRIWMGEDIANFFIFFFICYNCSNLFFFLLRK